MKRKRNFSITPRGILRNSTVGAIRAIRAAQQLQISESHRMSPLAYGHAMELIEMLEEVHMPNRTIIPAQYRSPRIRPGAVVSAEYPERVRVIAERLHEIAIVMHNMGAEISDLRKTGPMTLAEFKEIHAPRLSEKTDSIVEAAMNDIRGRYIYLRIDDTLGYEECTVVLCCMFQKLEHERVDRARARATAASNNTP